MTSLTPILATLPRPADKRIALRVIPAAERALRQGHPWLFASAITRQSHDGRSGDLAVIFDRKGRFLAVGLYDADSPIRVRVLQAGQPATIDSSWFAEKIHAAVQRRAPLLATDTTGYRLVHGENDGLPGLVIDRYDETAVLKLYTAAWIPHLPDLLTALHHIWQPAQTFLRLSRRLQPGAATLGLTDGQQLTGSPASGIVQFRENGLIFEADVIHGQKTGFFLDQRENRARVETLADSCRVLNVFAYTGGFSLYAARGGATYVVSLDMSRPALAMAERNFALNQQDARVRATQHEIVAGDAFRLLAEMAENGRFFNLVVIDPPSFAKKDTEVERALAAYARLVRLGLQVLAPNGILVMASCSSRVPADIFWELVRETAVIAGRPLIELARTQHPLDHPIQFPEGAYLKCLFARAP
ncbi:MAG: class I SAM-dependent rRNA methyltransferase [Chloroflexi bacterium]|nr:MAG: class I SAM-dependent rRNA methyltransferase [Chloroflexota bacterium]